MWLKIAEFVFVMNRNEFFWCNALILFSSPHVDLVSGMEVVRSYTAVTPTLTGEQDPRVKVGSVIYLMIKIYKNGALTPWIDSLSKGRYTNSVALILCEV